MLQRALIELDILVALSAAYVVTLYGLVLLRWYRPKDGGKFARMKLGRATLCLAHHPFVPLPAAVALIFLSLSVLPALSTARPILFVGDVIAVGAALAVALREPVWARNARLYFASPSSYIPGQAERLEWGVSILFLVVLLTSYLLVSGPSLQSVAVVMIIVGATLARITRKPKPGPQ